MIIKNIFSSSDLLAYSLCVCSWEREAQSIITSLLINSQYGSGSIARVLKFLPPVISHVNGSDLLWEVIYTHM